MRLASRHDPPVGLDDGTSVAGHVVGRLVRANAAGELIYEATSAGGSPATVVTSNSQAAAHNGRVRFRRLARLRAELQHPALLPVRTFGERAGVRFIVTDAYPEGTLTERIREGRLGRASAVSLFGRVADALDLCHANGLVHRALSTDSVLSASDHGMLDTFGLVAGHGDPEWGSIVMGTIRYASPEEVLGEPLEPASNIYSLTAMLVHALTGRPPYDGPLPTVPISHLSAPLPRASERLPELGGAFDEVVAWGMAKEASDRPTSAATLLHAAAHALGCPVAGTPPSRRTPSAAPRQRPREPGTGAPRARLRLALAMAGLLLAATAGGAAIGIAAKPFGESSSASVTHRPDADVIRRLDGRRAELRDRLAEARLPREQSAFAQELAHAYRDAARGAEWPALAAAAWAANVAYERLAVAADQGNAARFAAVSDDVVREENRFEAAAARAANTQQASE